MPNTTLEKPSAARRGGIDARDLGRTALAKGPASVEPRNRRVCNSHPDARYSTESVQPNITT
jgi:hypothetical protein